MKRMPPERVFTTVLEPVMEKVYDCQDCGECEERCPFKLPIRTIMKDYQAQYNTAKENWQKSQM
jgi:predicted aldo/keto reductase-like oxidoreductase